MKSLHVNFDETSRTVEAIDTASPEPWDAVCEQFDNDVHRIMAVDDFKGYTALFACHDENNQPVYYLVEESTDLEKIRKKTFLSKLGQPLK